MFQKPGTAGLLRVAAVSRNLKESWIEYGRCHPLRWRRQELQRYRAAAADRRLWFTEFLQLLALGLKKIESSSPELPRETPPVFWIASPRAGACVGRFFCFCGIFPENRGFRFLVRPRRRRPAKRTKCLFKDVSNIPHACPLCVFNFRQAPDTFFDQVRLFV